jgi:MYXO-CTERM domain-containing protein
MRRWLLTALTPLALAAAPDARADVVRAVVDVADDGSLKVVAATRLARPDVSGSASGERADPSTSVPGGLDARTRAALPGDVTVLDAEGAVLFTVGLPPLATHRGVVTPEGHDVGLRRARRVRLELPWPAEAVAVGTLGGGVPVRPGAAQPWPRTGPVVQDGTPAGDTRVWQVLDSGPSAERLDLVVLSEGYTAGEMASFEADLDALARHLGSLEPYGRLAPLLNVWAVSVPSADSGIDAAEGVDEINTAFGCHYGCAGIDRLVCCDEVAILDLVDAEVPEADGVLLLANADRYGGSGGFDYSVAYTGVEGTRVAAHELAHTLVLLWDEYTYGYDQDDAAYISPNCAPGPDAASAGGDPPWQPWIDAGTDGIGTFAGCSFDDWVRPTQGACMMRALQDAYCPVCREAITRALYRPLGGVLATDASPAPDTPVRITKQAGATFSVTPRFGEDILAVDWSVDDTPLGEGARLDLTAEDAVCGTLTATLRDASGHVLSDPEGLTRQALTWVVRSPKCGCGCAGAGAQPPPAGLLAGLLAAAALRRRARRRAPEPDNV